MVPKRRGQGLTPKAVAAVSRRAEVNFMVRRYDQYFVGLG